MLGGEEVGARKGGEDTAWRIFDNIGKLLIEAQCPVIFELDINFP